MKKLLVLAILLLTGSQPLNSAQLLDATNRTPVYPAKSANFSAKLPILPLQAPQLPIKNLAGLHIGATSSAPNNPNYICPIGFCANFILDKKSTGPGSSTAAGDTYWYSCNQCNNVSPAPSFVPDQPGAYQGTYNASGQLFVTNVPISSIPTANSSCSFATKPGNWQAVTPSQSWGTTYTCQIELNNPNNLPNRQCPIGLCNNFIWNGQYPNDPDPTFYFACGICETGSTNTQAPLPAGGSSYSLNGETYYYYQAGYNASGQLLAYTPWYYNIQNGSLSENGTCSWAGLPGLWALGQVEDNQTNFYCQPAYQQSQFQTCKRDSDCPGWNASCAYAILSSGCPFSCLNQVCVQEKPMASAAALTTQSKK